MNVPAPAMASFNVTEALKSLVTREEFLELFQYVQKIEANQEQIIAELRKIQSRTCDNCGHSGQKVHTNSECPLGYLC